MLNKKTNVWLKDVSCDRENAKVGLKKDVWNSVRIRLKRHKSSLTAKQDVESAIET